MPGGSKKGGGLEVGSAYKMKNSALHKSAKYGSPMHANYGSTDKSAPMKQDKNKMTVGQRVKGKVEKRTVDSKKLDNLTFSQAFRKARNAGVKAFTWKGKNYTTEVAKQRLAVITKAKLKKKE